MWHKMIRLMALAVLGVSLSACYVIQPQSGTNVVIQNPAR